MTDDSDAAETDGQRASREYQEYLARPINEAERVKAIAMGPQPPPPPFTRAQRAFLAVTCVCLAPVVLWLGSGIIFHLLGEALWMLGFWLVVGAVVLPVWGFVSLVQWVRCDARKR